MPMKEKTTHGRFKGYWAVREINSATIYCDMNGRYFFIYEGKHSPTSYESEDVAVTAYHMEEAKLYKMAKS
jgi:hypothetical protein